MALALRENPLFRLLLRRALAPRQLAAWVVYTVIYTGCTYGLLFLYPEGNRATYYAFGIGWFLGEFLICWMAADSIFPMWSRMVDDGSLQEVHLSRMDAEDVLKGFLISTGCVVSASACLSALVWTRLTPTEFGARAPEFWWWQTTLPMAVNHAAAGMSTATIALRRVSSQPPARLKWEWFLTICEAAIVGVFAWFLALSCVSGGLVCLGCAFLGDGAVFALLLLIFFRRFVVKTGFRSARRAFAAGNWLPD